VTRATGEQRIRIVHDVRTTPFAHVRATHAVFSTLRGAVVIVR